MSKSKLSILAEVAIFSAIALVFDKIPLFTMPQGGSVSLVMLPILLLALRHGLGVG
ncbi:energy-coupled thiamine transporter ThiT, partial [Streptococcus suis]